MTTTSKKKSNPAIVRYYLVCFNIVSFLGWAYLLVSTATHLFQPASSAPVYRRATTTYARVGVPTAAVQSLAILEVLHVLVGWVRSPLPTTAAQVASRLFLVWGIVDQFTDVRTNPLYTSMILSWSITEVIRYSFYAFTLMGYEPYALLWLRYTTFYVLYLTGASSEAFLIHATLPLSTSIRTWRPTDYARAVLFGIWWPGLYILYTYMIVQRRRVLGRAKGKVE